MDQAAQGDEARDLQCAGGDGCREADVPGRLPAHAVPDPASGCYEWHEAPDGKQPYYFTRRDGAPITIAGLWDEWRCSYWCDTLHSYVREPPVTELFVWVAVAAVLSSSRGLGSTTDYIARE
jgi:hypothetical protein